MAAQSLPLEVHQISIPETAAMPSASTVRRVLARIEAVAFFAILAAGVFVPIVLGIYGILRG